ncbi:MAG: HepT-like ribonuclease domain-containing protein [bacterium]
MSRHDDTVSMQHMLDHAREALVMIQGKDRDDLDRERMLQLSLTRLIEIVGEAASRVSATTRQKHPEIHWFQIVGARNRLIHGYDLVDWDILWDTVCEDLPPLVQAIENILRTEGC